MVNLPTCTSLLESGTTVNTSDQMEPGNVKSVMEDIPEDYTPTIRLKAEDEKDTKMIKAPPNTSICTTLRKDIAAQIDLEILKHLKAEQNRTKTRSTALSTEDQGTLFCKSLEETFKRLDNRKKQLARMRIIKLLFEVECETDVI